MGTSVLRVTTRCRDVDEFVRAFARQIDKDSLVVKAENPAAVGVKPAFAIALADGSFVMRGRAEVCPLARGMIRLRFLSLDDAGQAVRDRILGREPEPAGPREPLLTVRMAPLFPDEVESGDPVDPFAELAPVVVDVFVEEEAVVLVSAPAPRPSEPAVFARPDTIRPPVVEGPPADHSHIEPLPPPPPRPVRRATTAAIWRADDRARVLILIGAVGVATLLTVIDTMRGDRAEATASAAPAPAPAPAAAIAIPAAQAAPPAAAAPTAVEDDEEVIDIAEDEVAICHLVVDAGPAGATVTLGDLDLGPAPVSADVPCGTATLTVASPGYEPSTRTITLAPTTAKVRLRRAPIELAITSTPDGATVRIDGRTIGTTPLAASVRADRKLKLTVAKRGYKPITKRLTLQDDDALSLTLTKSR
jgi:hypothetical protein